MAKLLTTKGIGFFLDELFKSSKEFIYIVTPYFKIDKQLEERIFEALDNGIKVILIYGKDRQQINQIDFSLRSKIEILFYEDLHAKFYMNEKHILIASMNMHSYSQAKNREIGVLFSRKDSNDIQVIEDCFKEFNSIKKQSINLSPTQTAIIENSLGVSKVDNSLPFNSNDTESFIEQESDKAYEEFKSKWSEYLTKKYPKTKFSIIDKNIFAQNFPVASVDFSTAYGFITLKLNIPNFKDLKNKERSHLREILKKYRVYWNSDQIMIYHAEEQEWDIVENINYCSEALDKITTELQRILKP